MLPSSDLCDLVRQAQAGSSEAATALYARCREPLLAVIRRDLRFPLRRLFDSTDFLDETFEEIFTRTFSEAVLQSPQTLWPYLQKIAANKVRDKKRKYLRTKRYGIGGDQPIDEIDHEDALGVSSDDEFILEEVIEKCLADCLDPLPRVHRAIIQLLLQGSNGNEISQILHLPPGLVYHFIISVKKKMEQSLSGGG